MTSVSGFLLTTCHVQKDGLDDLFRLVGSVEAALGAAEVASLQQIILLQGCDPKRRSEIEPRLPDWVTLLSTERSLSSPTARNAMIDHLLGDESFNPDAFVGFPDDDCWYPAGSLACVAGHFEAQPGLQLLVSRYGPSPSAAKCIIARRATLQQALSRSGCAAIFVRASLLAELGGFHELLGLGTELRGGEDTEFVHRAFHSAKGEAAYVSGTLVGHAAADPAKKATYYEGGLAALMAHSRRSPAARVALLRKIGVGAWLVIRKRMLPRDYFGSLRKARMNAPRLRSGRKVSPSAPAQGL
ncbi:MAG TPA: hypothetical protein VIV07_01540 [Sphingomicrobium sp.]